MPNLPDFRRTRKNGALRLVPLADLHDTQLLLLVVIALQMVILLGVLYA
jgi:hypothetical protein